MKKIILQACCAPCSTYPIQKLKEEGYEPVVFFYNPNIFPFEEYEIRRNELKNYCKKLNIEYLEEKYENEVFLDFVKGLEKEPEKGILLICINFLLTYTISVLLSSPAQKAREVSL